MKWKKKNFDLLAWCVIKIRSPWLLEAVGDLLIESLCALDFSGLFVAIVTSRIIRLVAPTHKYALLNDKHLQLERNWINEVKKNFMKFIIEFYILIASKENIFL